MPVDHQELCNLSQARQGIRHSCFETLWIVLQISASFGLHRHRQHLLVTMAHPQGRRMLRVVQLLTSLSVDDIASRLTDEGLLKPFHYVRLSKLQNVEYHVPEEPFAASDP